MVGYLRKCVNLCLQLSKPGTVTKNRPTFCTAGGKNDDKKGLGGQTSANVSGNSKRMKDGEMSHVLNTVVHGQFRQHIPPTRTGSVTEACTVRVKGHALISVTV